MSMLDDHLTVNERVRLDALMKTAKPGKSGWRERARARFVAQILAEREVEYVAKRAAYFEHVTGR